MLPFHFVLQIQTWLVQLCQVTTTSQAWMLVIHHLQLRIPSHQLTSVLCLLSAWSTEVIFPISHGCSCQFSSYVLLQLKSVKWYFLPLCWIVFIEHDERWCCLWSEELLFQVVFWCVISTGRCVEQLHFCDDFIEHNNCFITDIKCRYVIYSLTA